MPTYDHILKYMYIVEVFRIWIRNRIRNQIRIHMFLGLPDPDPDPLVRGMDPDPNPDPYIIMQKYKEKP
jgi:hypothetical protein